MLGRFSIASLLALLVAGGPVCALAQQAPPLSESALFGSQVLTINQQRLFEESDFGISSRMRLEADASKLQAEIRTIESDLEIEERLLTSRRATLTPDEFQPLASAFDDKVEKIRAAWGAKDRDLKRQRDADQQKFFEAAVPVLAEVMQENGALMLIDQSAVILSLGRVDITQIAIARINARLAKTPIAPDAAPQTQTSPTAPSPESDSVLPDPTAPQTTADPTVPKP